MRRLYRTPLFFYLVNVFNHFAENRFDDVVNVACGVAIGVVMPAAFDFDNDVKAFAVVIVVVIRIRFAIAVIVVILGIRDAVVVIVVIIGFDNDGYFEYVRAVAAIYDVELSRFQQIFSQFFGIGGGHADVAVDFNIYVNVLEAARRSLNH